MKKSPTQSREGVKGQLPLAGCRDSVPAGVWGNAPTVSRATTPKEQPTKGAGSEASLPVTSRFLRSAPQLALPATRTLSRQMGATDHPTFRSAQLRDASKKRLSIYKNGTSSNQTCRFQYNQHNSEIALSLDGANHNPMHKILLQERIDAQNRYRRHHDGRHLQAFRRNRLLRHCAKVNRTAAVHRGRRI